MTHTAENDAVPAALHDALIEWVFDACEKYDLPLTNNEPRIQDGVQLHHIGDFTGDLLAVVRRALTRVTPPGGSDA